MKHIAILFFLSAISLLIHGYHYAVSDQAIFIPYILKFQNTLLYPNDILFTQSSATSSIFYFLIAQATKVFEIQVVFFVGYLIFQFVFIWAIWSLANTLLGNKKLSYIAVLPFLLPKFIAGTSTYTFDTYFGYRAVGLLFFLIFLNLAIQSKFYKSATAAALGMLFHPLSIIPSVALLPAIILFDSQKKLRTLTLTGVIVFISLVLLLSISKTNSEIFSYFLDRNWLEIIKLRDEYLFPSRWITIEWAALVFYLVVIRLFISRLSTRIRKNVIIIVCCSLIVFTLNLVLVDLLKLPLVAQLQLVRAVSPLAYISLALSPFFLCGKNIVTKLIGIIIIIALSLNIYWLLGVSLASYIIVRVLSKEKFSKKVDPRLQLLTFVLVLGLYLSLNFTTYLNLNQKFQLPKAMNPWIDIQLWAKTNTRIHEKFVVLPRQIGFRIYSERSIVADLKDGAVVMYDPQYAKKWYRINSDFANFYRMDEATFRKLKLKYGFGYIVTTNTHKLGFDVAYRNNYFVVYKL